MHRLFFGALLLLPLASVEAQEKKPDPAERPLPPPALELGGSTKKATLVLNPPGHVGAITSLFFTRNGRQVISVGADKTVQFWDVVTGERLKVLHLPITATAAALSPDGKTLAVGSESAKAQRTLLVNLEDSRILWLTGDANKNGRDIALAFSPEGDRLAVIAHGYGALPGMVWDGLAGIWDKPTENVRVLKGRPFTPASREMIFVRCLAFSPDGQRIALGAHAHGEKNLANAHFIDVPLSPAKPGKLVRLGVPHCRTVMAVAWTPDGAQVVTVDQHHTPTCAVIFWSAAEGKEQRRFKLGALDGAGLHFLNGKELLLTWLNDGADKKVGRPGFGQSILSLGDPITERRGPFLAGKVHSDACRSALAADGKLAAFTGGHRGDEIIIWETATGNQVSHLGGKLMPAASAGWSKDGKSLGFGAFVDQDKTPFFQYALNVKELQMSQNVAAADYFRQVRQSGSWSVQPGLKDSSKNMGFIILKNGETEVKVKSPNLFWHASTLSPTKESTWMAYAATTWGDEAWRRIHLVDLRAGAVVRTLSPRQRLVDMAPSPDGRFLLTAARDNQVSFIYRIADDPAKTDPQPLLNLFLSQGDWILWTKEGYYAASPGGERLMGWTVVTSPNKLPTFHPAERFRKRLYRPELIKLIFEKGSLDEALKIADTGVEMRDVNLDRLLPPKAVLTVVDQSKLPLVTIKVQAEAVSNEQPIKALRLMIGGRVVPGKEALAEFTPGKRTAEVEWTVELPEGDQELAVLARGPDSASNSPAILVKNINKTKIPVLHVLAIGINNYQDKTLDLEYAVADANALAATFVKNCKGQPFRDVQAHTLVNQQATRQEILAKLIKMRKQAQQQDLVVVFFACHGVKEKKEYYLLTHETNVDKLADTTISGADLRKNLAEFKCQVLLMLDACHSAGIGDGKLAQRGLKPATDDAARDLTDNEVGVAVMCAAMGYEKAEGQSGHGLFTQAVLDVLEKKPGVPINRYNQRVYVHHLQSYVFDEVSTRSKHRQHPFLNLPWVVESFVIR